MIDRPVLVRAQALLDEAGEGRGREALPGG
jgi:hypothetical protein